MSKLKHISTIVKYILETEPETRNDDNKLYVKVCTFYNPSIDEFPFGLVFRNARMFGIPSYKSVERARRKLQKEYEHLKSSQTIKEYRAEEEIRYKAFALNMQYE